MIFHRCFDSFKIHNDKSFIFMHLFLKGVASYNSRVQKDQYITILNFLEIFFQIVLLRRYTAFWILIEAHVFSHSDKLTSGTLNISKFSFCSVTARCYQYGQIKGWETIQRVLAPGDTITWESQLLFKGQGEFLALIVMKKSFKTWKKKKV